MTTGNLTLTLIASVASGLGTYLMLPHRLGQVRAPIWNILGGAILAVGAAAFGLLLTSPENWLASLFLYAFALLSFVGAVLMVTNRDPVLVALLFAAVVLSTSGLFLLAGAQFLAAGTVIVYAGAIIVTFLFVLMLAQAEGQALYDRSARSPWRNSVVAFVLLGCLLGSVLALKPPTKADETEGKLTATPSRLPQGTDLEAHLQTLADPGPALVYQMALPASARLRPEPIEPILHGEPPPHIAGLGATLFTDNLITVELAGTLIFVALVGAVAIIAPRRPIRPGDRMLLQTTDSDTR